jgi:hypothetical protein
MIENASLHEFLLMNYKIDNWIIECALSYHQYLKL